MSNVSITPKPILGYKRVTGIDLQNPFVVTALVAIGTFYLAKKAKLI